ncbi:MAG TPA: type II secretion system protein [Candidatus Babeliales bacterium]|nr:type II secretion system protein [Candidatus Babeliales bacterium]
MVRVKSLHNKKKGLTLIELMVVIVIIGIMATIVIPNLRRSSPNQQRKEFISYLNALSLYAMQRAVQMNKTQEVAFDIKNRTLLLKQQGRVIPGRSTEFEPVKSSFLKTEFHWSPHISFKNIFINGEDKMTIQQKLTETWFFITPEGIAQEVIINAVDKNDKQEGAKGHQFSLVLNPFTVQFKEYDTFQKP